MSFVHIIGEAITRLNELGIEVDAAAGQVTSERQLRAAEARMGIRLPQALGEFYREVGNGYAMFWQSEEARLWGGLSVPPLKELAGLLRDWKRISVYTPEAAEKYGFPYTKDPALAKRTAAKMRDWLPLIEEGNGDAICLDTGTPEGEVIFHAHAWMDGGTGDNGQLLATNLRDFVSGWASVCFQQPMDFDWPASLLSGGGVDWSGSRFRDPFRLSARHTTAGPT